jgi:L-iditol 2-dehydrogenase
VRAVVEEAVCEVPEPNGDGVLVHVRACGLCGSDVEKLGRTDAVLGHEVDGVLDDGTHVTVMHRVPCGECGRCLAGHESTCETFRVTRIAPGGFAERLRATHVVPLPDGVNGVWVEPLACVLRAAELVPRGRVLVVGCGAIGRLWIQVLQRRGDEIVAVDPRADRLASSGALVDAGGPVDAAVLTAHAGAKEALARLEPGGTLLVFAAPEELVPVSFDAVYRGELRIVGSRSATPTAFAAAIELLPSLDLPEVTTLPFERFAEGVDLYRRGEALKVVFTP